MKKIAVIALLVLGHTGFAEVLPSSDKTVQRMLPDEPGFKTDTEYKRKFEEVRSEIEALRRAAETARSTLRAGDSGSSTGSSGGSSAGAFTESPRLPGPLVQDGPSPSPAPSVDESIQDNSNAEEPTSSPSSVDFAPVKAEMLRKLPSQKSAKSRSIPSKNIDHKTPILPLSRAPLEPETIDPATSTLVFAVSHPEAYDETMTVLPAGSFVKARIVSGVEANTLEPYPVLLQLEYAFTGPNKTKVDLSNCFMIAKARANLSTERVIMETDTLSCVRESGEHFKSSAKGYTAGEDSTFGSTGVFISKQGQVMLAAVLASIAKNAGEAVATAQQTTTVAGFDRAQTATNVTGDKAAFIAGRATIDGAAMIAQWYLDYAKQLVPSIGVGSGQTVHVVMLETIRVPTLAES